MKTHFSPDGQWWWNGTEWRPVQPIPPVVKRPNQSSTFSSVLLALIVFAVIAVIGYGVFDTYRSADERDGRARDLACQEYDSC